MNRGFLMNFQCLNGYLITQDIYNTLARELTSSREKRIIVFPISNSLMANMNNQIKTIMFMILKLHDFHIQINI
jgi:hypothetical protein